MAVRKEYRGRCIGSALLSKDREKCRGKFEILTLSVFSDNALAIKHYKNCSFVEHGRLPISVKHGERYYEETFMYLILK